MTKFSYQKQEFLKYLKTFQRPETYEESYDVVKGKVSGLYRVESEAIWEIFKDKKIESYVEVGRGCTGGTLFLFTCLFRELKEVLSIDIVNHELINKAIKDYLDGIGIKNQFIECDSTKFEAEGFWDFVFIDGGHTGEIVKRDIDIWKDRCRYIGFHDFADRGRNKHLKAYPDVVEEIKKSWKENGWKQIGKRGRSEIIFETGRELR